MVVVKKMPLYLFNSTGLLVFEKLEHHRLLLRMLDQLQNLNTNKTYIQTAYKKLKLKVEESETFIKNQILKLKNPEKQELLVERFIKNRTFLEIAVDNFYAEASIKHKIARVIGELAKIIENEEGANKEWAQWEITTT